MKNKKDFISLEDIGNGVAKLDYYNPVKDRDEYKIFSSWNYFDEVLYIVNKMNLDGFDINDYNDIIDTCINSRNAERLYHDEIISDDDK